MWTIGIDRGGDLTSRLTIKLPETMTEVLNLTGSQNAANAHQLWVVSSQPSVGMSASPGNLLFSFSNCGRVWGFIVVRETLA